MASDIHMALCSIEAAFEFLPRDLFDSMIYMIPFSYVEQ